MKIKNIVFDFGGVLVDWNPRYLYEKYFDDKEQMESFLNNVCTPEWNQQQDAGKSLAEATKELQQKFPTHKEMIRLFYDKWEVMLKSEIPENVKVLYHLKTKYRLFGLTNWSGETFPIAHKRFPFFKELEGIVVSGDEKLIKPDKEIYLRLLDRYQLKADESIFIDDNPANIDAAEEIGFITIHFGKNTKLEEKLKQINIL